MVLFINFAITDPRYCCSVAQSCLTLCDPMDYSTPGFPVFYHLLEVAQTHVHSVSDAIQPSFNFMAAFTVHSGFLEPKKKSVTIFHSRPPHISLPWSDGTGCHDLSFLNIELFHSFLSPSSAGSLVPLCFLPLVWYYLHIWGCWYFSASILDSSLSFM